MPRVCLLDYKQADLPNLKILMKVNIYAHQK